MTDVCYGLVLAGGRSTRMGEDKGQLIYHGLPQREYAYRLLAPFCSRVYLSCRAEQQVPAYLHPLPDRFSVESPLNGLLTAFHHHQDAMWLTLPVDMPLVNSILIGFLMQQRNPEAVATCFFDSTGKMPEPLLALWEAKAGSQLMAFFKAGGISPREFLVKQKAHCVHAPDSRLLLNINTPAERKRAGL
ncbi:MAG: molybdenum cofactor guanylyltransferase [Bacteroidota bacterium]